MSTAVLASIQPRFCELIVNGKKRSRCGRKGETKMTIKCERCGKEREINSVADAEKLADDDCWDTVCGRFYCAACSAKLEDDYGLVMNGWYDVRRKLVEMVRGDSK